MINFKSFLIVFCILSLSACKEEENNTNPGRPIYTRSFVLQYDQVDSIQLRYSGMTSTVYPSDQILILIQYGATESYAFNSRDKDARDCYQELCQQYEDVTYNRTILFGGLPWISFRRVFTAQSWTKIDIQSDADYDAAHPSGTSLADITEFITVTAEPHIRSGYKEEYDWSQVLDKSIWYHFFHDFESKPVKSLLPIRKQVTELTPADLKLIGPGQGGYDPIAVLRLTTPPTLEKAHVFTVTFTDTEGKKYPANIYMRFENLP